MAIQVATRYGDKSDVGTQVTVKTEGGANAALFSDEAGTQSLANPVMVGQNGYVVFYVSAGTYTLEGEGGTVTVAARADADDLKADKIVTSNAQTGTAYTLALTDAAKLVEMNNAAANTLTVPTNATAAFPVGTVIGLRQYGAGQTTVAAAAGVTIRSRGGALKLAGQYAEASLAKRGADEWVLTGDVVA